MGNGTSTKVIIPSLTVIGLLVLVTMIGIITVLIRVFRKARRKREANESQNGLIYGKSGVVRNEKRTSFAVETSHRDSVSRNPTVDNFDNRSFTYGNITVITAQKMDDSAREFQPSPKLSTSVNTEDVVQVTEIGPGSLRKIELLTGSKVIPPPKPPPRRRRNSYDSRYSKRRYSHPASTRLSTVESSGGRQTPPLASDFSPTTFQSQVSYDNTRIHSLRAPPALMPRRDVLSWAGHPIHDAHDIVSISSSSDLDLPRTLNLVLPQHIAMQMKTFNPEYDDVMNDAPRKSGEKSRIAPPPPAARTRRYSRNLLHPQIQTHRRSWSGRSVLELDQSPAEERLPRGVVGVYAPNSEAEDENSPFYSGPGRTRQGQTPLRSIKHIAFAASSSGTVPSSSSGITQTAPTLYTPIPRSVGNDAEPDNSTNFLNIDRNSTTYSISRESLTSEHSIPHSASPVATILSPPPRISSRNLVQPSSSGSLADKRKSIMSMDGKSVAETVLSVGSNYTERELELEMKHIRERARRTSLEKRQMRLLEEMGERF